MLSAYDAELEVGSYRGERRVAFNQFLTGYRKTVLATDELMIAVRIPKLRSGERDFFWKVGTRRAQAISKIVMAAKTSVTNGMIESIGIGIGSVAPTVIRAPRTEAVLTGKKLTPDLIEQARHSISLEVSPITDLRSTEYYRRTVTGNVLMKFLRQLM